MIISTDFSNKMFLLEVVHQVNYSDQSQARKMNQSHGSKKVREKKREYVAFCFVSLIADWLKKLI